MSKMTIRQIHPSDAKRTILYPNTHIVVPARYYSERLPGKPLADIKGIPMVVRTAQQALLVGAQSVVIATESDQVAQVCHRHGLEVIMTSDQHQSGTERIAEVAAQKKWPEDALVVNVQGDEPLISPQAVQDAIKCLLQQPDSVSMATVAYHIQDIESLFDPNVVKLTQNHQGHALYFSRAVIPFARDQLSKDNPVFPIQGMEEEYLGHMGVYVFRVPFLKKYTGLARTSLERIESLEQLRVLYHGYHIAVGVSSAQPMPSVDTQEDLEKVRQICQA